MWALPARAVVVAAVARTRVAWVEARGKGVGISGCAKTSEAVAGRAARGGTGRQDGRQDGGEGEGEVIECGAYREGEGARDDEMQFVICL